MPYQQAWVADAAQLKVVEKSRRTGLTWAEAADDVLTAAKRRRDGGQNVYYIGYNMDMAVEYIEACAMWARTFDQVAGEVEPGEELYGEGEDERHIKTYTIRFPQSGFRIVALSSRPANLRGKQGVVVIDEAAFHNDLEELLKAALALLIWGGRVRVISTHNGDENPFNQLVNEIRAGRRSGSVHRIEFREAVEQGLYQRVCLRLGKPWTAAEQAAWVQGIYKFYGDASAEELDAVPSQGSGAWLSAALIEARTHDAPVLRYSCPAGFERLPEVERRAQVQDWLDTEMAPLLAQLDPAASSVYGQDFGRSGDLTVGVPAQLQPDLTRRVPFTFELRNMPHRQQHQVVSYLFERLPRLQKAALDARGNGHALAEALAQDYGWEVVELVMLSETWYREQMPPLKAAFEDATILLPKDRDTVSDLRAIRMVRGVARVPDTKSSGSDGGQRHGDAGIAVALMHYASRQPWDRIDYFRVQPGRSDRQDDARERAVRITAGWRTMKGIF